MMSFLDKVTKAVGDVVDKGKKDVDQFMKIQKINGEIGGIEKQVADLESRIEQAKQAAGEKAIELVRAGTLSAAELQPFLDQVRGFEDQIVAEQTAIAGKKADIEKIKDEHELEHAAAAATAVPVPAAPVPAAPPPTPAAPPVAAAPAPASAPAGKRCGQCGAQLTGGAFCPECGAKVG
jgi:hypothetical protein